MASDAPGTSANKIRKDYLDSQEYIMAMAFLAAKRSKDPRCQVGACVVKENNYIVGIGYNCMPMGCNDDEMPWGKHGESPLEDKNLYVCHAEMNAIINKNSADLKHCLIYVTLFPCNECAKIIIQSGIKEVIYYSDEKRNKKKYIASRAMLKKAGIVLTQYIPKRSKIEINFD